MARSDPTFYSLVVVIAADDVPITDSLFRAMVDTMPQLAWTARADGYIDWYNRRWYEYTGTTPEQMTGWGWKVVHDPHALEAVIERWTACLRSGEAFSMEFRLRGADGVFRWFLTRVQPWRDDAGRIQRWFGTNTNIDDQKKLERELTDSRHRLQTFVEASSTIVWTTDGDGHPIVDSPSWRAFTGQTEEEWRSLRGWAPVHPDDAPALRVAWPAAKANKTVFEAEFQLRRHDGVYVPMNARAVPVFAPDGSVREWIGVTQDISARKSAERARLDAVEREYAAKLEAAMAHNRWTTTLKSIGDAVITTDTGGIVTFMNPVAESLTGWSMKDAQGKRLREVFPIVSEETRQPVEDPVARVLEHGGIVALANHTLLLRRDGTELPIDDSAAPIRSDDGVLAGVVLVFRDVTEEKRAAAKRWFLAQAGEALAASSDYRDALATIARLAVPRLADWCGVDMIEAGSSQFRQVAVAHADPAKVAFAKEFGERYPPDPAARAGVPEVLRTGKSELYKELPNDLLEAGARDAEHLRLLRALKLESAMVVPLRGRDAVFGAVTFIYADSGRRYTEDDLAFAEDLARRAAMVIERRRLEEEREQLLVREQAARADAEIANRAKDEFLATVSHELRTPLNAILGWTVSLRRKRVPPDVERVLVIIERNARAQARIVEDVLDVSRIIGGKLQLELAPANVKQAIGAAVDTVQPAADAKGVTLEITGDDEVPIILADAARLQQIVWNLVSNAVKFTPKHGRVEVSVRRGEQIRIVVKDTGVGIRAALLGVIFEPFRQADASTTRVHGGLGLGLAIVRQLVHAHGGTIRAESEGEGRGASFTVELPARVAPPLKPSANRSAATIESMAAMSPTAHHLEGLRVLVVDDEHDARELVRAVLEVAGAHVETAGSAHEALSRLRELEPNVLVSDIGMPSVDGYSLMRKIRSLSQKDGGRVPAIALTAYARIEDADAALAAGFQMHVVKPVEPDELVAAVASAAQLSVS